MTDTDNRQPMTTPSPYAIGIDLGTTNCALSYVDMTADARERKVDILRIPQLVAAGEVQALQSLPSFVYLPEAHDVRPEMLSLPWTAEPPDYAVGTWARDVGSRVPGKVVSSAKSWLCYEGIDRRSSVLPYDRNAVPRQISPVDASRMLLCHLRDAWNHTMVGGDDAKRLENQEVILTVPASFDAVARELTVEAATAAGLTVRLLEEPQAAFYSWLHDLGEDWREHVESGDLVLVCDIGGGTTDFSLIAVNDIDGNLELERIAVGDHILLGGDNMDLTLAYRVADKIQRERGTKLDAYQLAGLAHACRAAKEKLGADIDAGPQSLTVLGRGSGVIGGTITTQLTHEELVEFLLDGFFPTVSAEDRPAERRRIGLRTFGLDYASDPAVTRHLAGFVARHGQAPDSGDVRLPQAVLFNGGVTKSQVMQSRILDAMRSWQDERGVRLLSGTDPDLAVSAGAAWYANVRREGGVRIKAGSARSYYLGIESAMPAIPGMPPPIELLCVCNFGLEEGSHVSVPAQGIGLIVGEPTEFQFFSSTCRVDDQIGSAMDTWAEEQLEELPQLVVELPIEEGQRSAVGTLVPVRLDTVLTEVGTLQLWCHDTRSDRRWKLEFELRDRD